MYMRHLRRTDVSSRRILNRALKPVGERENYFKGLDDIDAFLQDFPRMIKELCHVCAYGFQNMGGYAESEGRRRMLLITERVLGMWFSNLLPLKNSRKNLLLVLLCALA